MKALKKLVIGIVAAAVMMSSAAAALADETTATTKPQETTTASQPAATTGESTEATFDISKLSFDTMYGNQIGDYLNHQYFYNGEKIPLTESNYYFLLTFLQLSQYAAYGYYPATGAGYIDLAATYGEGDKQKTYGDHFVEQAEDYLQSTYIFIERAKAAGLKLSDEDKAAIENEIKDRTEQQAKPAGVSLDVILQLYFGPGFTEKTYRELLENATLAGKYQEKYITEYKIPEDKLMVPNIRYALFYAPGASASADDKKKAEAAANDLLKKCKNVEDLKTQAEAGQQSGAVYDQGTLSVPKGKMVSAFEDWAYGAARKEGEMGIIYSEEYGYFVVGYMGKVKLEDEEKESLANDALTSEIENEMKSGKHNFHTEQKFAPAKAAPTVAPAQTEPSSPAMETVPSGIPTESGVTPADNGMSNVLIIVFVVIGGIAIVAVVFILISNNSKSGEDTESSRKSSKKSSKKMIEEDEDEEEDDEEDEEYDEEGEEEEPEEQEDLYSGISEDDEPEEEKPSKKNGKKK